MHGGSYNIDAAHHLTAVLLLMAISQRFKIHVIRMALTAIAALLLGILVFSNTVQLWHVYVLALLLGVVNAFDNPTRQALVVELVGRDHLQNAIALNSTLQSAAPSIRATTWPDVLITSVVGTPRALKARAKAPFGSSSTGSPLMP